MTSVDTPHDGREPVDAAARQDLRGLFELEQVHRRGPASLICLARDLEYNQPVALKVMPRAPAAGADAEEAFHRAAALAAALDHPHIVPLYSAGATDRFFWCAMQYVEGRSLAQALRSSVPMEPAACLRVVGQVATALDSAHRLAVVHADLTPANVLLDVHGDAHVTDFWIPWVLERLGALPGDAGKARRAKYRAPEQLADGRCGPEADQHALAALLQACLMKTQARVPPDLTRAIERALSPAPENRFPSIRDFAVAVGAAGTRSPGRAARLIGYEGGDHPEYAPRPSRWRWVPTGVLSLVVLGAVAAPWLLSRGSTSDRMRSSRSTYIPAPVDSVPLPDSTPSLSIADSVAPADSVGPAVTPPAPRSAVASPPSRRTPAKKPAARPAPTPRAPRADAVSPLGRPGRLFINATPWGQVYVDGELLGNTPQVDVPVSPGPHRLRVVRDGFDPYEIAIRVQPDQELRITDIVLQEAKP